MCVTTFSEPSAPPVLHPAMPSRTKKTSGVQTDARDVFAGLERPQICIELIEQHSWDLGPRPSTGPSQQETKARNLFMRGAYRQESFRSRFAQYPLLPQTARVELQFGIRLRTLSETFQHPCYAGTFGESARDVDLALTLALTETLALSDLIRPTGSPPKLTPVLLAPPSMQGVRS